MRPALTAVAVGAATGAVLVLLGCWAVMMYGPETLFEWNDIVYDADGQYAGLR
ncbi:hypothetical protein [Mycobacterium sp. SMC-4]|uniref:hypothetical protein n=1 Tax=Mycobacterium sp. SMC-4 TaxID=2857059 RepID=UPI0021B16874|nr:hypothetical protein [Mycobacterium sp. SMC-4]UXA19566.1 hypothetical protein KXD98_08190 [Mycobacterium sp. SMC-4]